MIRGLVRFLAFASGFDVRPQHLGVQRVQARAHPHHQLHGFAQPWWLGAAGAQRGEAGDASSCATVCGSQPLQLSKCQHFQRVKDSPL